MIKQNLVILANSFVSSKGLAGGDVFYIELSQYLVKKYKISVILPKFAINHWREKNVNYIILNPNFFDQRESKIFVFLAYCIRLFQTNKIIKKFPAKTTFCSSSDFFPDVLPIFLLKRKETDYFWIARFYHLVNLSFRKRISKILIIIPFFIQRLSIYLAIKKGDLILVDNMQTFNFFKSKGISRNRLLLSGGSVHSKKLIKYSKKNHKEFCAVFAGRLDFTKGIFDLPKIWARVVKAIPTAKLAIVGTATAKNQQKLLELIKKNKIEKNVKLFGFLPHQGGKTIFDVFAKSKMFLSLTLEGGRDFVLIEAMACGLPVLAYNQPFLKEGLINKGFLTAPKNKTGKIAKLAIYLLKNPKVRDLLSRQALQEVKKLDWRQTYIALSQSLSTLG